MLPARPKSTARVSKAEMLGVELVKDVRVTAVGLALGPPGTMTS